MAGGNIVHQETIEMIVSDESPVRHGLARNMVYPGQQAVIGVIITKTAVDS
jgi:hypothetical protein